MACHGTNRRLFEARPRAGLLRPSISQSACRRCSACTATDADQVREVGDAELEGYITEILNQSQVSRFQEGHDLDFSYVSGEGGRFRVTSIRKETGIGATFPLDPE